MKKVFISVILFLAAAQTACRYASEVSTALRLAESQMEIRPDSALAVLEEIDPHRLTGKAIRARHALLYSQALDKNYIDLQSDSVIAPAVAYYSDHGTAKEKAYTNYYLGRIRSNANDIEKAVESLLASETFAKTSKDKYLLGRIYNCLGNLYHSQYSLDEALEMYDKAETCFQEQGNSGGMALMHKAKAIIYSMIQNHTAAEREYEKALHIFDSLGNGSQVCLLTRCLAGEMQAIGQVPADSVKNLLNSTYSRYTSGARPPADYTLWTWIHMQENHLDSARHYGVKALAGVQESDDKRCGLLLMMCRIEELTGNYKAAIEYWRAYYRLYDGIVKKEKEQLVQQAENKYRNRELSFENEKLHLHNKLSYTISIVVFVVAILVFSLILQHRRRVIRLKSERIANYRQFIGILNEECSNLEERCKQLAEEVGGSPADANLLNALECRLSGLLNLLDMAYAGNRKPADFFTAFKKYAATMGDGEAAFSDLQYIINRRFNGMVDYLRTNYPLLTNSELNMLCMLQFGFSFDCIRLLYNHENVDSLYSRRTKIREKLQLAPRYKLERFLAELTEYLRTKNVAV